MWLRFLKIAIQNDVMRSRTINNSQGLEVEVENHLFQEDCDVDMRRYDDHLFGGGELIQPCALKVVVVVAVAVDVVDYQDSAEYEEE